MAGTEYFGETAVQPRDHIPVNTMRKSHDHTEKNYEMFANPVFITPGRLIYDFLQPLTTTENKRNPNRNRLIGLSEN